MCYWRCAEGMVPCPKHTSADARRSRDRSRVWSTIAFPTRDRQAGLGRGHSRDYACLFFVQNAMLSCTIISATCATSANIALEACTFKSNRARSLGGRFGPGSGRP